MPSGEGNENGEKTTMCLISKKATLHVQHSLFAHFFAVILHDYTVKLPETSQLQVLQRKFRTCSCSIFFQCRSFSWPLAFLISSPPLQNFHVDLPTKNVYFVFYFSLQLSVAYFLIFSVSTVLYCTVLYSNNTVILQTTWIQK